MFVHPTNDYDFIIELEPLSLPRYSQNVLVDPNLLVIQGKYANQTEKPLILPGFDPAQLLLRDLQVCVGFLVVSLFLSISTSASTRRPSRFFMILLGEINLAGYGIPH